MVTLNETKFKTIGSTMSRWESLDEKEKVNLVKQQSQKLFKSFNKMTLSNQKFIEDGILMRKGKGGGRATTMDAINQLAAEWYLKDLETLKLMVKNL